MIRLINFIFRNGRFFTSWIAIICLILFFLFDADAWVGWLGTLGAGSWFCLFIIHYAFRKATDT